MRVWSYKDTILVAIFLFYIQFTLSVLFDFENSFGCYCALVILCFTLFCFLFSFIPSYESRYIRTAMHVLVNLSVWILFLIFHLERFRKSVLKGVNSKNNLVILDMN